MLDLTEIRKNFPITQTKIYLDNGARCALALPVYDAILAYYKGCVENGREYPKWWETVGCVREKLSALISAAPSEIAFFSCATHAVNVVAQGIRLCPGDNIVVAEEEFPSNLYPWLHLAEKGVEVRLVRASDGDLGLARYKPFVDRNTKVIAVSHVQASTGYRAGLKEFGAFCKERGIVFFVDATQSCGMFPIDVKSCNIDYLCASTYKWLLGTDGLAFLYGNGESQSGLDFTYRGWAGRTEPNDNSHHLFDYPDSIRRFELGNHNYSSICALNAGLDYISAIGTDNICRHTLALTARLQEGLGNIEGVHFAGEFASEHAGSLVTVIAEGIGHSLLYEHLLSSGIITSLKHNGVRFSPYFYNSPEEIEITVNCVKDFVLSRRV